MIAVPPAAPEGLQQRRGVRQSRHLPLDARQTRLGVLSLGDEQIDIGSAAGLVLAAGDVE